MSQFCSGRKSLPLPSSWDRSIPPEVEILEIPELPSPPTLDRKAFSIGKWNQAAPTIVKKSETTTWR